MVYWMKMGKAGVGEGQRAQELGGREKIKRQAGLTACHPKVLSFPNQGAIG